MYIAMAAPSCTFSLSLPQVGAEDRIHVYYAHGEDNSNLVRRCYWLLDKYVCSKV